MCGGNADLQDLQSKKPEDTDFRQQRLRAWQPLLTPTWVIGAFILIGVIFIPIGIVVLTASDAVVEIEQRYDNVIAFNSTGTLTIPITQKMIAPVFVYYKLTNFYQNHRRYVKSKSDDQLRGAAPTDVSSCDPLQTYGGLSLYPCGLIANSKFNDTFTATYINGGTSTPLSGVNWDNSDIAWTTDINYKFKDLYLSSALPSTLTRQSPQGYYMYLNDQDLIVWMRNAGLPTFRKLYRKINMDLQAGSAISLSVKNIFPTSAFGGQKSIILSTASWLGGKNLFLGWAYIAVGALCALFGIIFAFKHCLCGRPLGDMKYFNISFAPKQ